MATQLIVRLDPNLKIKVSQFAKSEGKSVSEIVRELLENYVKDRDIGSYIDDLWTRIGRKLENKGVRVDDIEPVIENVRAKK